MVNVLFRCENLRNTSGEYEIRSAFYAKGALKDNLSYFTFKIPTVDILKVVDIDQDDFTITNDYFKNNKYCQIELILNKDNNWVYKEGSLKSTIVPRLEQGDNDCFVEGTVFRVKREVTKKHTEFTVDLSTPENKVYRLTYFTQDIETWEDKRELLEGDRVKLIITPRSIPLYDYAGLPIKVSKKRGQGHTVDRRPFISVLIKNRVKLEDNKIEDKVSESSWDSIREEYEEDHQEENQDNEQDAIDNKYYWDEIREEYKDNVHNLDSKVNNTQEDLSPERVIAIYKAIDDMKDGAVKDAALRWWNQKLGM